MHRELEETVAEFVGKPAAVCFNMGYMTNASTIPAIMGKVRACVPVHSVTRWCWCCCGYHYADTDPRCWLLHARLVLGGCRRAA